MAGLFGGLMNGGLDMGLGLGKILNAYSDRDKKMQPINSYETDKDEQRRREQRLDYTPANVGDSIGPYQRSSSPVARAYLESILTGQNKQAASSPWADPTSGQRAENSFEETYGPYEALVAQGARERKATPWQTTAPKPVDQSANASDQYGYTARFDEADKGHRKGRSY